IPLKKQTQDAWPAQLSDRLYALGIDAYRLAPRLDLMRQFQHSTLQGMTGDLSLGSDQKIRRQLDWAQFKAGRPRALNNPVGSAQGCASCDERRHKTRAMRQNKQRSTFWNVMA